MRSPAIAIAPKMAIEIATPNLRTAHRLEPPRAFFLSRPALLDAALRIRPRNAGEFFLRKTRADRDAIARMLR